MDNKNNKVKEYLIIYEVHDLITPVKGSIVIRLGEDSTFESAHNELIETYCNSHIVVLDIKLLTPIL